MPPVSSRLLPAGSAEWPEALGRVPADVFHRPEYAAVDAHRLGGRPQAFVHTDGPRALLIPLVIRRVPGAACFDAISPYGYGGPTSNSGDPTFWHEALDGFQQALTAEGVICCLLRLHPLLPTVDEHLAGLADVVAHGDTVSMDLTAHVDDVARQIRTNHQRDIQRAQRRGCSAVVDDWSHVHAFNEMYRETMDRVGASDDYRFSEEYVPALRSALGDAVHLVTVVAGAEAVAAGVFFESGGIVGYHLGATRTEALSARPSKLMIDAAWRWAQARGNTTLHLGGGLGGSSDDSLFHFKAGFSARRHRFVTARMVLDEVTYEELSAPLRPATQPSDVTSGFFPAYRDADGSQQRAREGNVRREVGSWLSRVP